MWAYITRRQKRMQAKPGQHPPFRTVTDFTRSVIELQRDMEEVGSLATRAYAKANKGGMSLKTLFPFLIKSKAQDTDPSEPGTALNYRIGKGSTTDTGFTLAKGAAVDTGTVVLSGADSDEVQYLDRFRITATLAGTPTTGTIFTISIAEAQRRKLPKDNYPVWDCVPIGAKGALARDAVYVSYTEDSENRVSVLTMSAAAAIGSAGDEVSFLLKLQ